MITGIRSNSISDVIILKSKNIIVFALKEIKFVLSQTVNVVFSSMIKAWIFMKMSLCRNVHSIKDGNCFENLFSKLVCPDLSLDLLIFTKEFRKGIVK